MLNLFTVAFVALCRVCASYPMDRSRVCEEFVCPEYCSWQVGLWYHPVGDLLWWRSPPQREETHRGMGNTHKHLTWLYIIIHTFKLMRFCGFKFEQAFLNIPVYFLPLFFTTCPPTQINYHIHFVCMQFLIHMYVSVLSRRRGFMKQSANWPPQTAESWLNWWPTAWTTTPRRDLSSGLSSEILTC